MGNSPGRITQASTIILFHFFLFLPMLLLAQKPILQQPVTISVSGKSIAFVLDKLSDNYSVRFTYDPDDISAERRITLQANNRPLSEVLLKVFGDNSIAFREKGGQVVIFRDRSIQEMIPVNKTAQQEKVSGMQDLSVRKEIRKKESHPVFPSQKVLTEIPEYFTPDTLIIIHRDTILKLDTLVMIDTVVRRDTLILHDTVFIKSGITPLNNQSGRKDEGFFAALSGAFLLSEMILTSSRPEDDILAAKIETSGTQNLPGYSAGLGFGYQLKRWIVSSGINYTRFHQTFNYTYEHQTGGYFETDTIEKYYTLSGLDTSWYYITDSSWLEKQVKQYNYSGQNHFSYIEFPLSLSYSVYHGNFDLYVSAGAIAGVLPSAIGSFIDPKSDFPATSLNNISLNTFVLSVTGGAGARFPLNRHAGLLTEVSYRQQLSSVFKNYPVSAKFGSVSFLLGLTYIF
jgi:hypothetical protein